MNKTKKILIAVLCTLLLVALTVGATVAYLTSTDRVTNTFTVGNVKIKLDEAKVEYNAATNAYTAKDDRTRSNEYKLLPGTVAAKDPTITVLANSEECYVRAKVTVTCTEDAVAFVKDSLWTNIIQGYDSTVWTMVSSTPASATAGTSLVALTYELRMADPVASSTTDTKLTALFTGIKISDSISDADYAKLGGLKIDVVANAIQSAGFANAQAAWTAFDNK